MPQINAYNYLSITTWVIIIFYIFYYIIKQNILPRILETLKIKVLILSNTTKTNTSRYDKYHTFYNHSLSNL